MTKSNSEVWKNSYHGHGDGRYDYEVTVSPSHRGYRGSPPFAVMAPFVARPAALSTALPFPIQSYK
jgi:hypothetical protein